MKKFIFESEITEKKQQQQQQQTIPVGLWKKKVNCDDVHILVHLDSTVFSVGMAMMILNRT